MIVRGGGRLEGTVKIEGAKNAVLPIIAASLLARKGTSTLYHVPGLADVHTMQEVLKHLNAKVNFDNHKVTIDARSMLKTEAPFEYVRKMRASFLVMGSLLARIGHARIALPGGCAIGSRPIDQHLKGFEAMGARIHLGNGFVEAMSNKRLQGAKIYLDFPSVGATENLMMAAVLARGITTIENAAEEPEVGCLAEYLNAMGAKVQGAGTGTIRIEGVDELVGARQEIISDRIEAGTFVIAAAITGGDIHIEGAISEHLRPLIAKIEEMGVMVTEEDTGLHVIAPDHLKSTHVKTMPHPGFPTDLQPQMMALLLKAEGMSMITETVFENRFMHVEELRRMNGKIKIEGRTAVIGGSSVLQGTEVSATDLRAGAALSLAALVADGVTSITELQHIDRGYVNFTEKLKQLGADIERVEEEAEVIPEENVIKADAAFEVNPHFA